MNDYLSMNKFTAQQIEWHQSRIAFLEKEIASLKKYIEEGLKTPGASNYGLGMAIKQLKEDERELGMQKQAIE